MRRTDADNFAGVGTLPLFDTARKSEGPFAHSTVPPQPDEVLVASLIWERQGRLRPISIARLCELTKFTPRQVKDLVEQLIVKHGLKIGALRGKRNGYFVVREGDREDLEAAIRPYKLQILAMLRRLRVLEPSRHAQLEFLGQIRMELEGK